MLGAQRDADRIGVGVAVHAQHIGHRAGLAIDRAVAEHVGHVHRVLAAFGDDGEVGGDGELALDDGPVRAGLLVDEIDAVVGHRGDEQSAARIEGQVVESRLQ
jgi:hypothetical protein